MTIEELKAKSAETSERVAYLARFLKIADHEDQIKALEETMAKPDFWDDKEKAQETVQKLSSEKNIVEPFHQLQKHAEDFAALEEFAQEDESFLAEADTASAELDKEINELLLLHPCGRRRNRILRLGVHPPAHVPQMVRTQGLQG